MPHNTLHIDYLFYAILLISRHLNNVHSFDHSIQENKQNPRPLLFYTEFTETIWGIVLLLLLLLGANEYVRILLCDSNCKTFIIDTITKLYERTHMNHHFSSVEQRKSGYGVYARSFSPDGAF